MRIAKFIIFVIIVNHFVIHDIFLKFSNSCDDDKLWKSTLFSRSRHQFHSYSFSYNSIKICDYVFYHSLNDFFVSIFTFESWSLFWIIFNFRFNFFFCQTFIFWRIWSLIWDINFQCWFESLFFVRFIYILTSLIEYRFLIVFEWSFFNQKFFSCFANLSIK